MNKLIKEDIVILKINDFISKEEKSYFWKIKTKELRGKMYDRQQEGDNIKNREKKIYIGIISEIVLERYIKKEFTHLSKHLIIEGFNTTNNTDKFDILIDNLTFDVKSSLEKKENINNYEIFLLKNRNYILPVDQYISNPKNYTIQILYDKNVKSNNIVYICGLINQKELAIDENIKDLKLDNGKKQLTYMKKIEYGISFKKFMINLNNKFKEI